MIIQETFYPYQFGGSKLLRGQQNLPFYIYLPSWLPSTFSATGYDKSQLNIIYYLTVQCQNPIRTDIFMKKATQVNVQRRPQFEEYITREERLIR